MVACTDTDFPLKRPSRLRLLAFPLSKTDTDFNDFTEFSLHSRDYALAILLSTTKNALS